MVSASRFPWRNVTHSWDRPHGLFHHVDVCDAFSDQFGENIGIDITEPSEVNGRFSDLVRTQSFEDVLEATKTRHDVKREAVLAW